MIELVKMNLKIAYKYIDDYIINHCACPKCRGLSYTIAPNNNVHDIYNNWFFLFSYKEKLKKGEYSIEYALNYECYSIVLCLNCNDKHSFNDRIKKDD